MKKISVLLFYLFIFLPFNAQTSVAGLFPLENSGRLVWNFNAGWRFHLGDVSGAEARDFDDQSWEVVSTPHTVQLMPAEASGCRNYQGIAWYRKHFRLPKECAGRDVTLHFEAIMGRQTLYVNGQKVKEHEGGYLPFSFDITNYLAEGENELAVFVRDELDIKYPYGKQTKNPQGMWYTQVSGIWQSVWLEPVQKAHVADFCPVFDRANGNLEVSVATEGTQEGDVVKVALLEGGIGYDPEKPASSPVVVAEGKVVPGGSVLLPVKEPRLWSPDST